MRPNWPTTAPKLIQNLRLRVSDCHSAGAGMASHEMATEDCPEPGFSSSHSSYSFMSSGPLPAYHELPRDWISQDCSLPAHPLYTNKKRHSLLKGLTASGSTLALHSKNLLARGSKWRGQDLKLGARRQRPCWALHGRLPSGRPRPTRGPWWSTAYPRPREWV